MIFTLLSKTVLKNEGNSRVYFYLFLAGIVCYIILHYYLNSGERNVMLQKLNNYFYYIVPLDFAIGAWLLKTSETKSEKATEDEEEDNSSAYTDVQRLKIMKNLEDSKNMKRHHDEENRKNSSPFLKKDTKPKQDNTKHEQEQYLLQQQMMMEQEAKKRMIEQAHNTTESSKPKKSSKKSPEIFQADAGKKVLVKKSSKQQDESSKQVDTDLPIYEGK